MSGYTEPLYSAPIVLTGTELVSVLILVGASNTFSATLTAGTYYNHIDTDTGGLLSFGQMVAEKLSAADIAENPGVPADNWTFSTKPTGLSFVSVLERLGDTGDDVNAISSTGVGTSMFGWSADSINSSGSEVVNGTPAADDTTITGAYQRGYVWLPREILTKIRQTRKGTSATAKTNDASAAVSDGYGSWRDVTHTIEYVPGVLVEFDKSEDIQGLGYSNIVPGMVDGDPNICFETFWKVVANNTGAAPVVQYLQDSGTLTTPEAITFADDDWLKGVDSAVEQMGTGSPLLFRVTMRGHKSG